MSDKQQELQNKMIELEILKQQTGQIMQQKTQFQMQMQQINDVESSLDSLKKAGKNEDLMIPLGAGVFIRGKVDENSKVLVNVGSGLIVEKDIKTARELAGEQKKLLEKTITQMDKELMMSEAYANELQKMLISLSQKEKKP